MFWGWALTTLLLIVTIVINTAVLDEIENLIDDQLDGLARYMITFISYKSLYHYFLITNISHDSIYDIRL